MMTIATLWLSRLSRFSALKLHRSKLPSSRFLQAPRPRRRRLRAFHPKSNLTLHILHLNNSTRRISMLFRLPLHHKFCLLTVRSLPSNENPFDPVPKAWRFSNCGPSTEECTGSLQKQHLCVVLFIFVKDDLHPSPKQHGGMVRSTCAFPDLWRHGAVNSPNDGQTDL